jgi:hypothetical protein
VPVRLLPFFVEIQNARVWPFVIPPVRWTACNTFFRTETVRKPRKYEGAHLRGFRTIGSPWEYTLFPVTYRQRGANCACYIGVLPALLSVGFSGGRTSGEYKITSQERLLELFAIHGAKCSVTSKISVAFRLTQPPHLLAEMGHIAGMQPFGHRTSRIHMDWIRRTAFF